MMTAYIKYISVNINSIFSGWLEKMHKNNQIPNATRTIQTLTSFR